MISIICPSNSEETRKACLEASLKEQSCRDFELLSLDSEKLGLRGAAAVLNYGAARAKGEILLFVHQDITLLDPRALERVKEFCDTHEFGIAGVAGIRDGEFRVYSSVVQGPDREQAGEPLTEIQRADCVDECLFFVKKKDFAPFADLGGVWHFYAVDYCLRCRLRGAPIYLLPIPVYHLSPGWSINSSYWDTLRKLGAAYRGRIKSIPTTMGTFKNDLTLPVYCFLQKIRYAVGRPFRK